MPVLAASLMIAMSLRPSMKAFFSCMLSSTCRTPASARLTDLNAPSACISIMSVRPVSSATTRRPPQRCTRSSRGLGGSSNSSMTSAMTRLSIMTTGCGARIWRVCVASQTRELKSYSRAESSIFCRRQIASLHTRVRRHESAANLTSGLRHIQAGRQRVGVVSGGAPKVLRVAVVHNHVALATATKVLVGAVL